MEKKTYKVVFDVRLFDNNLNPETVEDIANEISMFIAERLDSVEDWKIEVSGYGKRTNKE